MTSPGDNPVKLKRRAEEHLDHVSIVTNDFYRYFTIVHLILSCYVVLCELIRVRQERVDATVEVVDLSASSHGVYDFTLDHK